MYIQNIVISNRHIQTHTVIKLSHYIRARLEEFPFLILLLYIQTATTHVTAKILQLMIKSEAMPPKAIIHDKVRLSFTLKYIYTYYIYVTFHAKRYILYLLILVSIDNISVIPVNTTIRNVVFVMDLKL